MIEPTPATDPPLGVPRGVGLPAEGESSVRKIKYTYEDYEEFGQWLEPFNVFDALRALAEELSLWFGAALTRSSPA